jgi:hypothetical protein
MRRARGYKRFDKARSRLGHEVNYYAHTAVRSDGKPDPNPANWQLLSTHLRNVAELAKRFAAPLGLVTEAEQARLLPGETGDTSANCHQPWPRDVPCLRVRPSAL